jgi:putative Mn2+ efflux pump MntP
VETLIEEVKKWYKTMAVLCIVSAFVTVILFIGSRYKYHTDTYFVSVVHFWVGFVLTVFFGIISVTVKKIHKCLILVVNRNSPNKVLESESEVSIAQKKCPKCGNLYDIDYPKCPFCKYKNNSNK